MATRNRRSPARHARPADPQGARRARSGTATASRAGSRTSPATCCRSRRARSIRRCGAWRTAASSSRGGGCPRTTAAPASTRSRRAGRQHLQADASIVDALRPRRHAACSRPSRRSSEERSMAGARAATLAPLSPLLGTGHRGGRRRRDPLPSGACGSATSSPPASPPPPRARRPSPASAIPTRWRAGCAITTPASSAAQEDRGA